MTASPGSTFDRDRLLGVRAEALQADLARQLLPVRALRVVETTVLPVRPVEGDPHGRTLTPVPDGVEVGLDPRRLAGNAIEPAGSRRLQIVIEQGRDQPGLLAAHELILEPGIDLEQRTTSE